MRERADTITKPHTPKIETLHGYPLPFITMHMNPLFLKREKERKRTESGGGEEM
jgi:hypothetical protein